MRKSFVSRTGISGHLSADHITTHKAPWWYRLSNWLRPGQLRTRLAQKMAPAFSRFSGALTITQELSGTAYFLRDIDRPYFEALQNLLAGDPENPDLLAELQEILDRRIAVDLGLLDVQLVTDAGVAFLVDDWDDDTTDITTMNYHASGTGAVAAAVGDTTLGTEATGITDRATGTKSQPAANQLRSIGTQNFTGSGAITEHGLFSVVTESAGTLWDRHVFSAINVNNGDSIQWTYTCTVNSGG